MACKPCEERRKLIKNAIKTKIMLLKLKGRELGVKDEHFRSVTKGKTNVI